MEKEVARVFTNDILQLALNSFGLDKETENLNGFENYVFEAVKAGNPYILRITHSSHRTREQILAEIDWMNHLYTHGVNVPTIYLSQQGEEVVPIEAADGTFFYACLFSKAPGKRVIVTDDEVFNEKLFYMYGKTVGLMHNATRKYKSDGEIKRPQWDDDDLISNFEKYIPQNETAIYKHAERLIENVKELPKNSDNFGLVHTDLHTGNFFYDGDQIYPFDFDDSAYIWYASDIAIPLYYSAMGKFSYGEKDKRQQFADIFLKTFMEGYESVTSPPKMWKEHFPVFLQFRDLTLYLALNKKLPEEERTERIQQMFAEIRERLVRDEPIVALK